MEVRVYTAASSLKRIKSYQSGVVYKIATPFGVISEWLYDPSDTTTANNYTDCVVNAAGQRIKRNSFGQPNNPTPKIRVIDNANVTISADDVTIVVKNNTAAKDVTLPAAANYTNRRLRIKAAGTGNLTTSIAIRTSDSATTTTITNGTTVEIQSDGSEWWVI